MVHPSIYIIFAALFPSTLALCTRKECKCLSYKNTSGWAADCTFENRSALTMAASDIGSNLQRITINGGHKLTFDLKVFENCPLLETVTVRKVKKVYVKKDSFANMTSKLGKSFEFTDASLLILEEMSWKSPSGPISVLIARIEEVVINKQSFDQIENFTAVDVSKLVLKEKAFSISTSCNISLERVNIDELVPYTFPSSIHQLQIKSSFVLRVHGNAFSAVQIEDFLIENTTLHTMESAAVSEATFIRTLTLNKARIFKLASSLIVSGLTNLVLTHSELGTIFPGAINVTVANVLMDGNVFTNVHKRAIVLNEWNKLTISNNTFKKVDREAFFSPVFNSSQTREFNFTDNTLYDFTNPSFDFSIRDDYRVSIDNNFFSLNCSCDMNVEDARVIENDRAVVSKTGLCSVNQTMSRCYQIPQGFTNMWNFTKNVCQAQGGKFCDFQQDAAVPPQFPNVISSENDHEYVEKDHEMKILRSIFVIAVLGMLITMFLSTAMWLGRQNCCTKARRLLLPSTNSFVDRLTRFFSKGDITPAVSISRISVHEYAELQKKIEDLKIDEDLRPLEEKATQTLPEELTQELLQSLKEKLNDPENYGEARDMIEHLYDLIKVEESCNKNLKESTTVQLEPAENLYDVIVPRRAPECRPELVSTGTRAPSPDKLAPYSRRPVPVSDYMEPRDQTVYTYTELPPTRPDLLPGLPRHYEEVPPIIVRPLPDKPNC